MVTVRDELLRVEDLAVSYGRAVTGLRKVSLEVHSGEVVALLGSNGAGKSTLLRAISGSLAAHRGRVDAGTIAIRGQLTAGMGARALTRVGVAMVPEGRRVFGAMTVEENLRSGSFAASSRRAAAQSHERVLDLFPVLAERRSQHAGLLSGGEQQMLAIGRALMGSPQLLLLDEPSLGLAPKMVDKIGEIVDEINGQGTSVLLVEQNAAMALKHSNRAYVLEVGEVQVEGYSATIATSNDVQELYLGHRARATTTTEATRELSRWSYDA